MELAGRRLNLVGLNTGLWLKVFTLNSNRIYFWNLGKVFFTLKGSVCEK